VIVLDIHCRTCHDDGDKNPPRFVRFVRDDAGTITPQPFKVGGQAVTAYPHRRPDGGITWQLQCPQGHNRPIRHERILEAFDTLKALGKSDLRITL